jgi:peptidoglycan/LPS O-acetylase OafA/YrhL
MLMLNSVHLTSNLSWNIPAWAIGAEFLTYAVFPQILWISRIRTKIAIILYLCSLVFLAVLAEKLTKGANLDMTWDYGFMRCLIEFTGGVILYNLYLKGRYQWVLFSDMALIVSLAVTLAVLCFFEGHDLLVVPAYGALIVTAAANQGKLKNLLSSKLLKLFGEISYAIYLVHWLMLWVFFDVATRLGLRETLYAIHGWGQFVGPVVYLLAVLIVSFLLHRWLEKPMRERINKMSFARPLAP